MKTWFLLPLFFCTTLAIASEDDPDADASEPPVKNTEKAPLKSTDPSKRQCRGVHLGYEAPAARAAYIEVTPEKSSPGTYFCALGFNRGYLGIQDFGDGRKIAIFSVWGASDPTDSKNPPPADEQPVTLVQKGDNVLEGRLGGYGMAGQARLVFRWEIGKPTRFFLQAKTTEDGTDFTAHVFDPLQLKWRLVGIFRSHDNAGNVEGLYSFIEDFRRNFESAKVVHKAEYSNGWVLTTDNKWQPLLEARFTADATSVTNVDAGPVQDGFFLQTGGDTENKTGRLWQTLTREAKSERPVDVDELLGK
ncbi:DUF3472 domain-containing protein [Luteolibacter ambystomatis]|uniref:DUF3472 domain-containing protein n=1 Tax=Luteolibacter ambystomatis TaxID=2824561 RepID=A0A975PG62_9BACT|nr:DUF3472 domain-containing protein [Luteolibacter ambystomatis]QUE52478.1 DUF3472 domain-containing protein [Luteolibacter ambystomatis]